MRRLRNHPKREVKPAAGDENAGGAMGMESAAIHPMPPKRGTKKLKATKHKHMR